MSGEKWTKGPWFVRKWDGEKWPEKRIIIGPQDNHIARAVAISPRYVEEDQMLADAYLIAAAPLGAELAKMVMEICGNPNGVSESQQDFLYEMALQFAKKARGEE